MPVISTIWLYVLPCSFKSLTCCFFSGLILSGLPQRSKPGLASFAARPSAQASLINSFWYEFIDAIMPKTSRPWVVEVSIFSWMKWTCARFLAIISIQENISDKDRLRRLILVQTIIEFSSSCSSIRSRSGRVFETPESFSANSSPCG